MEKGARTPADLATAYNGAMKKRVPFHLLIPVMIAVAAPANAGEPSREAVIALLQGYEWEIDRPAFEALGAEADTLLLTLAGDENESKLIRARAAAVLSIYPTDEVWGFYLSRLNDSAAPVQRRRAVDALCHAFAGARAGDLIAVLAPVLTADDVHLRTRAATCLQSLPEDQAAASLQAYRQGITDAWELRAAGFTEHHR
ncbi:MAG: hypothetical protein WD002_05860 [Pseudomonadales bacterium]